MKTAVRKIAMGALIGAGIGAIVLFFFGDGFAMAFALAVEGIVFGGAVGAVIGLCVFVASLWSRKTT